MTSTVDPVKSNPIPPVETTSDSEEMNLDSLTTMVVIEFLEQREELFREEGEVFLDREKRCDFLAKYTQALNKAYNGKDEYIDLSHSEVQRLIEDAKSMLGQYLEDQKQIDQLTKEMDQLTAEDQAADSNKNKEEIDRLERKIAWFKQRSDEIEDTLRAANVITNRVEQVDDWQNKDLEKIWSKISCNRKKLNKDERGLVLDQIKTQNSLLQSQNQTQNQTIQRLNSERTQIISLGMQVIRTLHESKRKIAQNITR